MRDVVDKIIAQSLTVWRMAEPESVATVARLARVSRLLDVGMKEEMARFDADPWEFDVLASLARVGAPYRLTVGALLSSLMVSSGALTNRVDRLVAKGVVSREVDPGNRRQVLITLTEKGRSVVEAAGPALDAHHNRVLSALTPVERAQLASLLRKVLISLGDTPEARGLPTHSIGASAAA
ncbi:MAG TPA: MarR family transcriptional regulator [Micromonosporaceae bacterium]|nr:MarR family transcriptional regulator [Micromonosporaceae bacterium]